MDLRNFFDQPKPIRRKDRIFNGLMLYSIGFSVSAVIYLSYGTENLNKFAGTSLFITLIILVMALYRKGYNSR